MHVPDNVAWWVGPLSAVGSDEVGCGVRVGFPHVVVAASGLIIWTVESVDLKSSIVVAWEWAEAWTKWLVAVRVAAVADAEESDEAGSYCVNSSVPCCVR